MCGSGSEGDKKFLNPELFKICETAKQRETSNLKRQTYSTANCKPTNCKPCYLLHANITDNNPITAILITNGVTVLTIK